MPVTPGPKGVKQEMDKWKAGTLHSGSPSGPIVKNQKQAIAISLHEAGLSKTKPNKPNKPNKKAPMFTPKVKTPDAGGMY